MNGLLTCYDRYRHPGLDRELKKGSAELLILSLLEARARHGYELSKLIHSRSGGQLTFHVDSLYPSSIGWRSAAGSREPGSRRRRTAATVLPGHCRRPPRAGAPAQDLGGVRGGGPARDRRRACLSGLATVQPRLASLRLVLRQSRLADVASGAGIGADRRGRMSDEREDVPGLGGSLAVGVRP